MSPEAEIQKLKIMLFKEAILNNKRTINELIKDSKNSHFSKNFKLLTQLKRVDESYDIMKRLFINDVSLYDTLEHIAEKYDPKFEVEKKIGTMLDSMHVFNEGYVDDKFDAERLAKKYETIKISVVDKNGIITDYEIETIKLVPFFNEIYFTKLI